MSRRGFRWMVAAVLIVGLAGAANPAAAQFAGSEPVPEGWQVGFDSITPQQAKEWLGVLAGPTFYGRGTEQPGFMKAAHWVAGKVAEFGLEPAGEGGTYFQMMPLTRTIVDAAQSQMTVGDSITIEAVGNIGFNRVAGQPLVEGNIVFIRMAEASPPLEDDLSLEGRVVLYYTDDASASKTAQAIAAKRATAALRIVDSVSSAATQPVIAADGASPTSLTGSLSKAAALQIIHSIGGDEKWFDFAATNQKQVVPLEQQAKIEVRIRKDEAKYPNVCAWLEGADPALRDEYIVIGAHLDHLGRRGDAIYFGADDNGSGSTAILSIARALATNPTRPKRSVLLLWFTGEEMGLLGSAHYCDHPLRPLEKMVCMFNIDMVGRNEEKEGEAASANVQTIHLIGSKQGHPDLHDVVLSANQHVRFEFEYDEEGVFGRSDQANFFRKAKTSVAFLFGGFHPDYHQPTDQPEKINYDKIAAAARLIYLSTFLAAEHGPFPVPTNAGQ